MYLRAIGVYQPDRDTLWIYRDPERVSQWTPAAVSVLSRCPGQGIYLRKHKGGRDSTETVGPFEPGHSTGTVAANRDSRMSRLLSGPKPTIDNMSDDFSRPSITPAMLDAQRRQQERFASDRRHREMVENLEQANAVAVAARAEQREQERLTAESTQALAIYAAEQHEENRRLRYLTNLLAFAVIFDVVNGTFDDHTWWTTLIALGTGTAGLGGALLLGRWRTRRAAAAAAAANRHDEDA